MLILLREEEEEGEEEREREKRADEEEKEEKKRPLGRKLRAWVEAKKETTYRPSRAVGRPLIGPDEEKKACQTSPLKRAPGNRSRALSLFFFLFPPPTSPVLPAIICCAVSAVSVARHMVAYVFTLIGIALNCRIR